MKELTLKEIQEIELGILIEFDNFCKSNNIKYSLYGGTLLGAVRHKGFIPWDDDIDVLMTRNNYDKFINTYKSNKRYTLINYGNNKGCTNISFSKIFDNNTDAEEDNAKKIPGEGVWLDIFPFDYLSNNKFKRKLTNLHFLFIDKLIYARAAKHPSLLYKLLRTLFFWKTNKRLLTSLDKYSHKVKESNYLQNLSMVYIKDLKKDNKFPSYLFNEYTTIEFCGYTFPCMSKYSDMLRLEYGDYMKLPPINERHSHSMTAYKKENTNI
ncbi:MAG: LicD family protein [Bacilli bacterium]